MSKMLDYHIAVDYLEKGQEIPTEKLVEYVLDEFEDSCFAENWKNGYDKVWTEEDIHQEIFDLFRYEVFNWCGCGCVEDSNKAVYQFLQAHLDFDHREERLEEAFGYESIYDNILLLCLAYSIDAAGLTEHGTSIGGAWVSDRGKIWMWLYTKLQKEEQ